MKEQLISFEIAKLAKEKGFNINTYYHYDDDKIAYDKEIDIYNEILQRDGVEKCNRIFQHNYPLSCAGINEQGLIYGYSGNYEKRIMFSTQALLQKWLREIHGIHIIIIPTITSAWTYKTVTVLSKRDNDIIMGIKSVSDLPPYKEVCGYDFSTYELTLENALENALKLII